MIFFIFVEKLSRRIKRFFSVFSYKAKGLQFSEGYFGIGIRFNNPSKIRIGNNISLADGVRMWTELPKSDHSCLIIDDGVQVNRDVVLDFTGFLHLKKNVLISEGAMLYTHTHGYDPRAKPVGKSLIIDENVWIGTRAIILPSVSHIGARSIIGAGVVVSKDIPEDSIVVSQSQRILKKEEA